MVKTMSGAVARHSNEEMIAKALDIAAVAAGLISFTSLLANLASQNFEIALVEFLRGIGILVFWAYGTYKRNVVVGLIGQVCVSWIGLTSLMVLSGGFGSLHLYWLIILPSLCLLLGLRRIAILLGTLSIVVVIGIATLGVDGNLVSYARPEGSRRGFSALLCMSILMWVSYLALSWRDALSVDLEREIATNKHEHLRKNQFLVHMNHEIRNPLNAVLASVEALEILNTKSVGGSADGDLLDACGKRQHLIRTIKNTCFHIVSIVNDVLDIEKLEGSEVPEKTELFSVRALGSSVADIYSTRAADAGYQLVFRYQAGMGDLWVGTVSRIRQILLNLISNALQHSGGAHITVTFSSEGDGIRFEVKDDGKGIPVHQRETLFEPFLSSVIGSGSSGLGLGICKLLVEKKMGGSIVVESGEARGTTFIVKIPLVGAKATSEFEYVEATQLIGRQSPQDLVSSFKGLRLLMVEDDVANGQLMRMLLEMKGFDVTLASTSQEALEATARGDVVDIALIDYNLGPHSAENGIGLTQQLADIGLRVVLGFTGNFSRDLEDEWKSAGALGIIHKPAAIDRVLAEISGALALSGAYSGDQHLLAKAA